MVSCELHLILFIALLSVLNISEGYATNRNLAQPKDHAREFNLENNGPKTTSSSWTRKTETTSSSRDREPGSKSTSFLDVKYDWLTSLSKLPGQDQCGNTKVNLTDKIVGGHPAELGAWPWMAALGIKKALGSGVRWNCGATLISKRHVLTAAHCVNHYEDDEFYGVRLGDLNLDPLVTDGASPVDYKIAEKIIHPGGFGPDGLVKNDIAILRLEKDVTFTDLIKPICLPFAPEISNNTWVNYSSYVTGWGVIKEDGDRSWALQQVEVPVWDNKKCQSAYNGTFIIDERHLCAGLDEGGKDSCQGDSGGPLMVSYNNKFYHAGIVSFGEGCARPGLPGVYTRVTNYLEWIAKNTI